MELGQVCLRKGEETDVRRGKVWIYDNEIAWADELCQTGCVYGAREAAADVGRQVRLLEPMMQSRDHPADLSAENAWYLKGYILQVL